MTVWLSRQFVIAVHDEQLAEHGGAPGIRDENLLESALARPLNRAGYSDPDIAELAALYALGVARNHPFVDGNKRTAWVLARLFIALNGRQLRFTAAEAIEAMLALAAGEIGEAQMADWLRDRISDAA